MKNRPPNRVERALAIGAEDVSRRAEFIGALTAEPLWFPIAHHPEMPRVVRPQPGEHVPFWIAKDDAGQFVPIFSAADMMKALLARFTERYYCATMPGRDLFAALARQRHAIRLNPGAKFICSLDLDVVRRIARGELTETSANEAMHLHANLRTLAPEDLPPALVAAARTECDLGPGIRTLWLADLGTASGAPDLRHLHAVVEVLDVNRTPTDNLHKVLRLALQGREVEMVRLDQAGSAESLANLRALQVIFSRPAGKP